MGFSFSSRRPLLAFVACAGVAIACGSSSRNADDPGTSDGPGPDPTSSSTTTSTPPPPPDAGSPKDACVVGEALCLGKDRRRFCAASPSGATWNEETCAVGSGCFQGTCSPGKCSDECTLGASQGAKTCAPLDIAQGKPATSDPATKMHDRARDYLAWLNKGGLVAGSVGDAVYSDPPTYSHVTQVNGLGDSAIWTGTLLASEALRLRATGAADARDRVHALLDTLNMLMNVSGEPGMLARYARESAKTLPFATPDLDCNDPRVHCFVDYANTKYNYVGHISRDQYQGVILGYALAYDALTSADEDLRDRIRKDVVTFVRELMKERTLSVAVTYNGFGLPVASIPIRFIVVSPREMVNGSANIQINSSGADKVGSMYGFQEFTPDLGDILKHLPGINLLPGGLISLPRSSSAIMLASFFRVAIHVTEGAKAWSQDHDDILAFYTNHSGEGGNVADWLAIAKQWTDDSGCGDSYYGNNITMEPMYNLARLETDPIFGPMVRNDVLGAKLWPAFVNTKNSFFSFIYAGVTPGAAPAIAQSAADQLGQFPVAPRVQVPVDLTSSPKYPSHDGTCANEVVHSTAVDVGDRVPSDFLWQRQPWGLYGVGDPSQTHPGVDYLVAYFMGRFHGFMTDDTPGTCLAWQ